MTFFFLYLDYFSMMCHRTFAIPIRWGENERHAFSIAKCDGKFSLDCNTRLFHSFTCILALTKSHIEMGRTSKSS